MRHVESRAVMGASVLAAGATMPLHLLPVLVMALSADGRLEIARAGWVGSAYMLGQLASAIGLPLAGVTRIPWIGACAMVVGILASAWISDSPHLPILLASWFAIGCFGGALYFLATTTAASALNRRVAFATRMAASSALGACVILGLQLFRPKADYGSVVLVYLVLTALVGACGLSLLATPDEGQSPPSGTAGVGTPRGADLKLQVGLAMLFCLFVGQHGLAAFALKGASQRDLPVDQLLWALALCKMVGAAMVFATARTGPASASASTRWPGLCVALGATVVSFTGYVPLFWIALLLWEIGLNILSARFQAALAYHDPIRAGKWITAMIFLGSATGPAAGGAAYGGRAFMVFAGLAALTALAPSAWVAWAGGAGGAIRPARPT